MRVWWSVSLLLFFLWGPMPLIQTAASSPELLTKLENLGKLYQQQCLPKGKQPADLEAYHLANGLSEKCWKYITEINHLDSLLIKYQNQLEAQASCKNGACKLPADSNLTQQLNQIGKVEQELSCTEPKKKSILKQCPADLECVAASSALSLASLPIAGIGGYLAEQFLPDKNKIANCHLGKDSCVTQLATAFFKSTMTYLDGAWNLLKSAGKATSKKMNEFWNWVIGAENHTSTSQLALAKASEDPGIFQAFLDDFPGTMKKIWSTFVLSIKEWLKNSIFCQKWEGSPHLSKCLIPTNSYDCLSCKTLVTGMCGISGTIVAEIVPSFLAGGLVTAVKHGAQGAARISKLFKVSKASINTIKASNLGKNAGRVSKVITATKAVATLSLKAINTYLLSPARKVLKTSYGALTKLAKKGTVYVAESATGRTILFSGKVAKNSLKVILYPVDNPLTTMAYNAGAKSMDKVFKLGSPKLGYKTVITSTIIEANAKHEKLLARIEKAKLPQRVNAKELLKLEEELLTTVTPIRRELLQKAFRKGKVNFPDLIKHLYPELQYGSLAKTLPRSKIIQAEKELYKEISRLPSGATKSSYFTKYKAHVGNGQARAQIMASSPIVKKKPIEIPNITSGLGKVLAPTLRSNQSKEEETPK